MAGRKEKRDATSKPKAYLSGRRNPGWAVHPDGLKIIPLILTEMVRRYWTTATSVLHRHWSATRQTGADAIDDADAVIILAFVVDTTVLLHILDGWSGLGLGLGSNHVLTLQHNDQTQQQLVSTRGRVGGEEEDRGIPCPSQRLT